MMGKYNLSLFVFNSRQYEEYKQKSRRDEMKGKKPGVKA
jgi:hypothetical protein